MQIILQVNQVSKRYGEQSLFEGISFGIESSRKVALVARNGKGKSTLLNIIAGRESADSGSVIFRNGVTIGYLEQEPGLDPDNEVFEEVFSAPSPVLALVKEHEQAVMANDLAGLERLIPLMDARGAWGHETRVKQVLSRLKIDRSRLVKELSGGQKKRVGLAKVLINDPDFLILDEPTNHLDVEMIEWLEEYLEKSQTTLLMVTHDRYFLDRVCNHIIELDDVGLYSYAGNYSYYLEKRAERVVARDAATEKARALLRAEQEWIRKMPRARGHKAKYRIDNFHKLNEAVGQGTDEKTLQLDGAGRRLGTKILELEHVSKRYGDLCLLDDFSYKFTRGEKIGIIGKNGVGKTTFLDIVTRATKPDSGTMSVGETVVYGYYTQAGISFTGDDRPIDIVREIAETIRVGNGNTLSASQFLEHFLFPDRLQYAPVSKLSGGERRRLYLLTVLIRDPNFLILDEPTNDLDIVTLNILEEYLRAFRGCLLVVSHDRFFTDKIVDHLFAFEGNGIIKDFPGNYTLYREARENESRAPREKEKKMIPPPAAGKEKKRKRTFREQQEMLQLETDMEALSEEKSLVESALNSGTLPPEALQNSSRRLAEILELLDKKETRWLELSEI
ncbi:MAG: ABC-F family ATP-binding cassette domain-containing protein [Odoribacteraceae bacterium]|nr:ABC-F family ATP-binding cassette domain-containing protein [Odoribacteraceae bacterium]